GTSDDSDSDTADSPVQVKARLQSAEAVAEVKANFHMPRPSRQPPPPPPPRRVQVKAPDVRLPQWRYLAPDGQERLAIRSGPGLDAPTTGGSLGSGEVFTVVEERPNNGVLFLKLASGGWVFDRKHARHGRKRRSKPLCVPYQVPLIEDEDGIKAHKVRRRGKEVRTVTKAKKRRRTAMVDPYMTAEAGNVIEVDSDDARPERSAAKQAAKEQLRLQLERKQHEVQERQSLPARQVLLGRSAAEAAHEQILDEKRRELQAMLARKRALSGVGVQKPPRYVD
ncbi:unnamed protein product, partial [Effrenium voratum]